MPAPTASDYLAKAISQNKIITFRLLSRELSIHVNEAKNELAAYHAASRSSPQPTYATFLLSGDVTIEPKITEPTGDSQESNPASTQPQEDVKVETDNKDAVRFERRITLAGESDVEVVKAQYTRLLCVHIYSISATHIKDCNALAAPMERVRTIDGERGVDHARKVGMTVAPNAKWSKALPKSATVAKAQALPPDAKDPSKALTSSKQTAPAPEPKKKTGLLDWSKSKPKDKAAAADHPKPKVKTEETGIDSKTLTKLKSNDKSPAPSPKVKVEEAANDLKPKGKEDAVSTSKETLKVSEAAPKKRVSTARPLSKQANGPPQPGPSRDTTAKPASKQITNSTSKKGTLQDSMMHRPDTTAATTAGVDSTNTSDSGRSSITPRLKKGRITSDEEDEEDEAPVKRPFGAKRKSVALTSDDEDEEDGRRDSAKRKKLVKGKSATEERRKAEAEKKKQLERMMDDEEEEEEEGEGKEEDAVEEDIHGSGNDSAPEHVPHTKAIRGMPKKDKPTGIDVPNKPRKRKEKVPIGSNGKPKKKVTRTEKTKNAKGFDVMKDVSDWETDSQAQTEEESDPESKPPKKKPTPSEKLSAKTKPKPKPKVKQEEIETEEEGDEEAAKTTKPKPRPSITSGKRKASPSEDEAEKPKQAKQSKVGPRDSIASDKGGMAKPKLQAKLSGGGGGARKSSQGGIASFLQKK
ncbi:hypothetical protein FRB95_010691 [Tulasnella sp. JGI-2019a]|nr:hypothetical protein FRB95_010691 [Tulasnella sp. JGI-2019a]